MLREVVMPEHDWIIVAGYGSAIQKQIIENLLSRNVKVIMLDGEKQCRRPHVNDLLLRYPESFFSCGVNMLSYESLKAKLAHTFKLQNGRFIMIYVSANARLSQPMLALADGNWNIMMEEDIKPFFNAAKAFVESRKEWGYGSFLHVLNKNAFKDDESLLLANIAAVTQMECIARLSKEAAPSGILVLLNKMSFF